MNPSASLGRAVYDVFGVPLNDFSHSGGVNENVDVIALFSFAIGSPPSCKNEVIRFRAGCIDSSQIHLDHICLARQRGLPKWEELNNSAKTLRLSQWIESELPLKW